MIGKSFGHLTVESLDHERGPQNHRIKYWSCRCSCGGMTVAPTGALEKNRSVSCQKCKYAKLSSDFTGTVSGHVTAERMDPTSALKRPTWLCRCKCGSTVKCSSYMLCGKGTRVFSCGCDTGVQNGSKLIGRRYGRLVITGATRVRVTSGGNRLACLVAKCDCGLCIELPLTALQKTRSCGCYRRELSSALALSRIRLPRGEAGKRAAYASYRARAEQRGLEFSLTLGDFTDIALRDCHYCGAAPSNSCETGTDGEFVYSGVDRMDSSRGYSKDNCVPACKDCNVAKLDRPVERFVDWAHRLSVNLAVEQISHGAMAFAERMEGLLSL
jgi:hypothetical protein